MVLLLSVAHRLDALIVVAAAACRKCPELAASMDNELDNIVTVLAKRSGEVS